MPLFGVADATDAAAETADAGAETSPFRVCARQDSTVLWQSAGAPLGLIGAQSARKFSGCLGKLSLCGCNG